MSNTYYSNIAIDMGGKYTGFISYTSNDLPDSENVKAAIIEMPDDGSVINYTVKNRTAVRHHLRANNRYKKARKLIFTILADTIKRNLTQSEQEAISSLMLRRGYTRLETEIDLEQLKECPVDLFFQCCPGLFTGDVPLYDQFINNCNDDTVYVYRESLSSIKETVSNLSDKTEKSMYGSALKTMVDFVDKFIDQKEFGHKHRTEYLANIRKDIQKDSRLNDLIKLISGEDRLYNCIGNISNLQLRALRWYFNDRGMSGKAVFDKKRFKDVWYRAYKYFHYTAGSNQKDNAEKVDIIKKKNEFLKRIEQTENITDLLLAQDPVFTIPPYEDQNNRRPPVDQTLLLSPQSLDAHYPEKWELWVQKFMDYGSGSYSSLSDELEQIVKLTDRSSRLQSAGGKQSDHIASYTEQKLIHSYYLQRLLDITYNRGNPESQIRKWAQNPNSCSATNAVIKNILGESDIDSFFELANNYYREVSLSKKGLWSIVEHPLLEISGIHPPMKSKMLEELVAGVLNIRKGFNLERFKEVWNSTVKGKSTVRSLCSYIEKTRKKYGNCFKQEYKNVCRYEELKNKASEVHFSSDIKIDKEVVKVYEYTKNLSKFIGEKLELSTDQQSKFANPFSLAQLYTILETDVHGFSGNCKAVCLENTCRMQMSDKGNALCCRLPAESTRPFDGSLGNILDRQAYEIAKIKIAEIKELSALKNTKVKLSVLVEENSFEFSSSLSTIKKSLKAKQLREFALKAEKTEREKWKSKDERLKNDSHNICAYTGMALSDDLSENDHIVSRSETKESYGTIYNSEFNLIRVSRRGNQLKGNNIYTLDNLNPKYLEAVFGTSDTAIITTRIRETLNKLLISNPNLNIDIMTEEERQCCRHALFTSRTGVPFNQIIQAISKQYRARVNGTQAWFVKNLIAKIDEGLREWKSINNITVEYNAYKIDAGSTSEIRHDIGKLDARYEKKDIQPITSHAIDAVCLLGNASTQQEISEEISGNNEISVLSDVKELIKLIPDRFDIIRISSLNFAEKNNPESKQLFKDTIYAEHFLCIMEKDDTVKVGFDFGSNSIQIVKGGKQLLSCLANYLESPKQNETTGFRTYKVCKTAAFKLFERFYRGLVAEGSDEELAYLALMSLRYTTLHQDVFSLLYDVKSKKFAAKKDILKNLDIKISFPSVLKLKTDKASLVLPSFNEWAYIASIFEDYLGKKDEQESGYDKLKQYLGTILNKTINKNHAKSKRVYSLPVVASPSGGVRIKRLTHTHGDIYQLVAANTPVTSISKGFASADNGDVLWDEAVMVDSYTTKNLTVINKKISGDKNFVSMDEQRLVYESPDERVYMTPATDIRRGITIEQKFEKFVYCIDQQNIYKSFHDLPTEIKTDPKIFMERLNIDICGKPRGNLKILSIGNIIKYSYMVESSNRVMNQVYNNPIDKGTIFKSN
ncbi:MAG: type II-B CRISPR-associated RNA-guided endonuclease Cas9/Csx12 [Ruminobacter sp.]|uniref:type II-B CRISPR-associated RNA-guided endonuclease Cas9/Csx12 n=1 Tax=Ruminobacter sp. TaxID=2774296 RepID=UPI00257BB626|nr:type II-B CRISPR-associated RNA-guided endonuclease Cas9/Csx12 [Ruminobacter sp.]MBQ3775044.1 type II-B CRISPR-associated RNA-guided endonuclease Cas9/Csx12 [Ruminobacter sp.]